MIKHTAKSTEDETGIVLYEGRLYQSEKLLNLLVDAAKRSKRFILTKDANASKNMPEYHRYYADGVMFDNGTIILYQAAGIATSGVRIFPSLKDMMMSSPAHEYALHWLDPLQPEDKEKTHGSESGRTAT